VLYHFVTALVTMIASLAYLLSALVSHGYGGSSDITWVHYLDWVITTPMLLIDLGSELGGTS
jgi:bacteriorhodopsin